MLFVNKSVAIRMRRVVDDQDGTFQSDHFLSRLLNSSDARFALFEHAPTVERRQRFRGCVLQNKLPLTFIDTGINVPLILESYQDVGDDVTFRSAPFIFSGVWVRVTGKINSNSLEGRVRFERHHESPEEIEFMTESELQMLRERGLSV